jgi:uncharacterized protein YigA (DUF484 family)
LRGGHDPPARGHRRSPTTRLRRWWRCTWAPPGAAVRVWPRNDRTVSKTCWSEPDSEHRARSSSRASQIWCGTVRASCPVTCRCPGRHRTSSAIVSMTSSGKARVLLASRSPEGLFWDWPGDTEVVLAHKAAA